MPKSLFNVQKSVITDWTDIFEDLYINTIPISYLESIRLEFDNGRIWEIDVKKQLLLDSGDNTTDNILETFREYQSEIVKLDFKIDIVKIKRDITKNASRFL
jgi:hypothetical protein